VTKILPTDDLLLTLEDTFKAFPNALLHVLGDDARQFPAHPPEVQEFSRGKAVDTYLLSALHSARLIKSQWEIEQIRKANDISSRAHEAVMRVLAEGVKNQYQQVETGSSAVLLPGQWSIEKEHDAEAIFVAACLREG
jgi:Xaa-Pro dipeptidase